MLKSLFRDRIFLILLFVALAIRLFSLREDWVERFYTYGFYPYLSRFLRALFGWIPFSIGDLFYILAFIWLVVKTWKLLRILARRQVKEYLSHILFAKYLRLVLWIYIIFNLFWGLNYNRQGIAMQLGLQVEKYDRSDMLAVTEVLLQRVNQHASILDTTQRSKLDRSAVLFENAINDFSQAARQFPFLRYPSPSLKTSLYSYMGHYFGFTGYFNPFTSEAQLNADEPIFIKPFIVNHEIGHQLGYGKENEASFVSYLACRTSQNVHTRYSVYYELFTTAFRDIRASDSVAAHRISEQLHPRVKQDRQTERLWRFKRRNRVAPVISDFYDSYLRMNNQPNGVQTYNEVIAWLIAYMKKYGSEAI
jgi:hypothetical protein